MQITSLIGKQILSPAGEKIGYVVSAYPSRDFKKISCFLCADEDEEEFFLPAKNVLHWGDALVANRSRISTPTGLPCPVGSPVYTHTGEWMGALGELLIGDEADPLFIVHKEGTKITLPLARVSVGDIIMVYPVGCKKPAAQKKPARKPAEKVQSAPAPSAKESPAPAPVISAPAAPAEIPAVKTEEPEQPATESAAEKTEFRTEDALNRLNLLGRKVKKTVYDQNGYPIALAGDRITEKIVSLARRNNRLLQLTVNTLTNVI